MIIISELIKKMTYDLDLPIFRGWEQISDDMGNHILRKEDREIHITCSWPGLLYGIILYHWEREKGIDHDY